MSYGQKGPEAPFYLRELEVAGVESLSPHVLRDLLHCSQTQKVLNLLNKELLVRRVPEE